MRLLYLDSNNEIRVTSNDDNQDRPYAILSHTWGEDADEVTYGDVVNRRYKSKAGYTKLLGCAFQAQRHGFNYFWVDTCCIDKTNNTELTEAIISMFRWYQQSSKCYVYLSDVTKLKRGREECGSGDTFWSTAFRRSRWFTRGWTLQELLASQDVEFYSREWIWLGDKNTLEDDIHEITHISIGALRGTDLAKVSHIERLRWAEHRQTKKAEDRAYSLLGIFGVHMSPQYGEGFHSAVRRLAEEFGKLQSRQPGKVDRILTRVIHSADNELVSIFQEALRLSELGRYRTVEASLQRVEDLLIGESKPVAHEQRHVHWNISRPTNTTFTGRAEVLQDLEGMVLKALRYQDRSQPCRIVITGMGGQGKTELCLQLATRVRSSCWGVFWVDVSTTVTAAAGFADIASRIGVSSNDPNMVTTTLAGLLHPWLLVLDNADDFDFDYQPYIPSGSYGVVILTSRNAECGRYGTSSHIQLENLTEVEGCQLVLKAAHIPIESHDANTATAMEVVNLLQAHTLALVHAGAYISQGYCTLKEYPNMYKNQKQRLLKFRPSQAQSRHGNVYATFEVPRGTLYRSTSETAKDALQLLDLIAMVNVHRLPISLFHAAWSGAKQIMRQAPNNLRCTTAAEDDLSAWHLSHLPDFLGADHDEWDQYRLIKAVNMLTSLALVRREDSNDRSWISMHPLVHDWADVRQEEQQRESSWISMACTIALGSVHYSKVGRSINQHLSVVMDRPISKLLSLGPSRDMVALILSCMDQWIVQNRGSQILDLVNDIFQYLQVDRNDLDPQWTRLFCAYAQILTDSGKHDESVRIFEMIVKLQEQLLPENHYDRLAVQHELASGYAALKQHQKSLELLEYVVKIEASTLTEDSLSRLTSQMALAKKYAENGFSSKAIPLAEHVVKVRQQDSPEDDDFLLYSQSELAKIYLSENMYKQAITVLEHVLKIQSQLEENNPSLLTVRYRLAKSYFEDGQLEKSISLLEALIKLSDMVNVKHTHATLNYRYTLGNAYIDQRQTAKAIALLQQASKIANELLPEDDSMSVLCQFTLAQAYYLNKDCEAAIKLYRKVIEIEAQSLPEDDTSRLLSQSELARALQIAGQLTEACQLLEHVFEIERRVLSSDDPCLLITKRDLSNIYRDTGRFREAQEMDPGDITGRLPPGFFSIAKKI